MRKVIWLLTLALLLPVAASAEAFFIPSYWSQSDFLRLSPSTSGDAAGALFNPALWGIERRGEVQFYWNDIPKTAPFSRSWTLLTGAGGLGFAVQHWDYSDGSSAVLPERSLNDFTVGMGFGDRENRFGIGYSWSKGDVTPSFPRENLFNLGWLTRPNRYLSIGAAARWAPAKGQSSYLVDAGVRPLGTPMATLFGDAVVQSNQAFKDVLWSAGVEVQPAPGVAMFAKTFHSKITGGETILTGLTVALGGAKVGAAMRSSDVSQGEFTTYGVRLGAPQPSILSGMTMKDKQFVRYDFTGRLKYQRFKLFDEGGWTLMEILERLEQARKDPSVQGVVLKITEDMSGNFELIWEVREKLKELQASGKKVVVFLERGGMGHYYLASAADRVMVDPETMVPMLGFNLSRTYYKRTLQKLGIGFDEWRFFKYKSAMEGFAQTEMGEGDREQLQALADGWYEILRSDVCASRGITPEEFDHIVNVVGILDADSLLHYKLADTTGRWDDVKDLVKSVAGSKRKIVRASQFARLAPSSDDWGEPPQVAVIYALGPCSMNDGINARRLEKIIKRARDSKRIKAVVFRADSPGGDILPSDIVAQELKKTADKKPVIVSQGMVAGSGGYWISMFGDTIVASPWTITGSIGVIGGWFYNDGLGDKLGMDYDNVQRGDHADIGSGIIIPFLGGVPERNLTSAERDRMKTWILAAYDDFLTKVAEGRGSSKDSIHTVAQGRVWTGVDGKRIGLIDELGGMETAISLARKAAGIKPKHRASIVEWPEKGIVNPAMFTPKLLGIKLPLSWEERQDRQALYLKLMMEANGRPVAMMPPDTYPETW